MNTNGTLDAVMAAAGEVKGKLGENLRATVVVAKALAKGDLKADVKLLSPEDELDPDGRGLLIALLWARTTTRTASCAARPLRQA